MNWENFLTKYERMIDNVLRILWLVVLLGWIFHGNLL